jgi:signal transduction histidine kinase
MREEAESADAPRIDVPAKTGWTLIGQLAAGIAHEIKTPTQFVSDNVSFLQDSFADLVRLMVTYRERLGELEPKVRRELAEQETKLDLEYLLAEIPRALAQSADGLARIKSIVAAIKELSHPDQDRAKEVDLNQLVRSSVTVCTGEWKHATALSLELANDLPPLTCLPGPLSQVIINLIVNAVHAIQARPSPGDGLIRVATELAAPGIVEIRVTDNGAGMPEHVRARIFERYFTTKPAGQGTGQGLALAREIVVHKHGGVLAFESEVGRGTTFLARLPVGGGPSFSSPPAPKS